MVTGSTRDFGRGSVELGVVGMWVGEGRSVGYIFLRRVLGGDFIFRELKLLSGWLCYVSYFKGYLCGAWKACKIVS